MYPLHFTGALPRVEDPREARNRAHLVALRDVPGAQRRTVEPARAPIQIQRIAFAGGWTSRSADFGAVCCA